MIEVAVTIKDEEVSMTEKFLIYEPFMVSHDDASLQSLVKQTQDKIKADLHDPDIMIKIKFPW